MTRTFYSYSIFFSCLYIVTTLIQSIAYFLLGGRMIELSSIREWMIFSTAIDVVWSLILLKYYHARQYTVAFTTMMITVTATLIHFVIYYRVLSTHELSVLFFFGIMLVILSGLTHG